MVVLRVLGSPQHSRLANSQTMESSALDSSPLEAHRATTPLSKNTRAQLPLAVNFSRSTSSPAMISPPSTVESFTTQQDRLVSSRGAISRSPIAGHICGSISPSELSDSNCDVRQRANSSNLSLPIFSTSRNIEPIEALENDGSHLNGGKSSLDLSREELSFTHWRENTISGNNTTKWLQSYGHYVTPRGGSLQNSRSLRLEHNPQSITVVRKDPTRFLGAEKSHQILSCRESQFPTRGRHGATAQSGRVLSRSLTPSSKEPKLIPVQKKVPSDTCCAGALPKSGPSHQRPTLPPHQRYLLGEVQPSENSSQSIPKLAPARSVSQKDAKRAIPQQPPKSHSLSRRGPESSDLASQEFRSGDGNRIISSPTVQNRSSCQVDVEIISPLLRDILQIMADYGESISKPTVPIEFSFEKESSLPDQSPELPSKPSFDSETSSIKPPSTTTRRTVSSNGFSSKQQDETVSLLSSPRSSSGGFSLRKFSGIESRIKKNNPFVRPSTAGSISGTSISGRKRPELGKKNHYSDLDAISRQDPIASSSKAQKFEALLKASDESNGGTIKMSLSSKIDDMSDTEDLTTTALQLQPPLNLNPDLFSTNNWFGTFRSLDSTPRGSPNLRKDDVLIVGKS